MFLPPCQRLRHSLFVFIFLFYTPVKIFLNHFLHTKVPSATLILKSCIFLTFFLTSYILLILLHTKYFKVKIQNVFFVQTAPLKLLWIIIHWVIIHFYTKKLRCTHYLGMSLLIWLCIVTIVVDNIPNFQYK